MQKHKNELLFYMDDSGSRDPDRKPDLQNKEPDWFALGGLIVDVTQKAAVEDRIDNFRAKWDQVGEAPLRSYNIRNRNGGFGWLGGLTKEIQNEFYGDLTQLIIESPIVVLACVVHRPGYNARYLAQYRQRRWSLCKTAFNIAVERAAKFALHHEARMRVFVERSDIKTESRMKSYFDDMRSKGLPFNESNSAKYRPLTNVQLKSALLEFGVRTKSSKLMQLADLVLWPACRGGYDTNDRNYKALKDNHKLLDMLCTEENGLQGIKYSCFPTA